ncbi:MAG: c-type cytochrome [Alphaproteobacteria bacterium]|nr:c-type cytochrome [Alphaproteobacteria bacterium]
MTFMKPIGAFVLAVSLCFAATAAEEAKKIDLPKLKAQYKRPKDIPHPKENPYSQAKATLGKALFFDPRLSRSGVMSCATCHNPSFSWGEWHEKGVGDFHKVLGRKDPTVLNLAWDELYFWDGRADSLEAQALGPIEAEGEMNMKLDSAVGILKSIKGYRPLFEAAFPGEKEPITKENIGKAIATFERTIVSGEAPFDRWIKGDEKAISAEAKQGFELFNTKAKCASCHSSWRFSDGSFHDIGLPSKDVGRGAHLDLAKMKHAFKTVGLRNIDQRAPYMHDGSVKTLEEVVDHYDKGFVKRPSLSDIITPLGLTPEEKKSLVAFMKTLTSVDAPVTLPILPQ